MQKKKKIKKTMREKIILRRRTTARQITLPSRETFAARYEKTSRQNLPRNVTVRRTRRIGPRKPQKKYAQLHRNVTVRRTRRTQEGGSFLSSGLGKLKTQGRNLRQKNLFEKDVGSRDIGLRAVTSEIGKKLIDERIKHAPELYKIGTSKIKNKNLKKALESDVANYIVEETRKKAKKQM